jgi:hypothetical protein
LDQFIFFAKTTDGATWSTPLNVTGSNQGSPTTIIDDLAIFANATTNTIDILWWEDEGQDKIMHMRSTNNGDTFSSPTIAYDDVSTANNIWYDVRGDDIFILIHHLNTQDIHFIGSYDGGSTFPTDVIIYDHSVESEFNGGQQNYVMTSGGGTGTSSDVFIMFTAQDFVNNDLDIYVDVSNDGGQTWNAGTGVVNITPSSVGSDGGQERNYLLLDHANNDLVAIFDINGTSLNLIKSSNLGSTWGSIETIEDGTDCHWSAGNENRGVSYDIAPSEIGVIHVLCRDFADGGTDVLHSISTSFGSGTGGSFSAFTSIANNTNDSTSNPLLIDSFDNKVYATWFINNSTNYAQHFSYSNDTGTTWSNPEALDLTFAGGEPNGQWGMQMQGTQDLVVITTKADTTETVLGFFTDFDNLPDNTAPIITLSGNNPSTITLGSSYPELGATCIDDVDGDLISQLVINATDVNVNQLGQYFVTYDCQDTAGNDAIQKIRTVNVITQVGSNPDVTLNGGNVGTMEGEGYTELGATCTDTEDGDLTNDIDIFNNFVDVEGSYEAIYSCIDSDFNSVVIIRNIVVGGSGDGEGTTGGGGGSDPVQPDECGVGSFTQDLDFFSLVSQFHKMEIGGTEEGNLDVSWNSADTLTVTRVVASGFESWIGFLKTPFDVQGTSPISTGQIPYTVQVPSQQCNADAGILFNCAEPVLVTVPITIIGELSGSCFETSTEIQIDLTTSATPTLLIIIVVFIMGIGAIMFRIFKGKDAFKLGKKGKGKGNDKGKDESPFRKGKKSGSFEKDLDSLDG